MIAKKPSWIVPAGLGALLAAWGLGGWILTSALSKSADMTAPSVDLSIYRHVVHVGWVVRDLDRVLNHWEKLGLKNIRRAGAEENLKRIYRGKMVRLSRKLAFGEIGGVQIVWIQPLEGEDAVQEFLSKHGDGIHHLAYDVRTPAQLAAQVEYFKAKKVAVVEEESWDGPRGKGGLAYLDTAPQGGGLTIELISNDPTAPVPGSVNPPENEYPFSKIVQYALLVRDVKSVGAYYEQLGFGGMPVDHNISVDRNYRGRPVNFEMYLGWWRWGDVTFEWIQSLVGPSVYEEYLKTHGEGFHHLAFNVDDIDKAVELFKAKGVAVAQSGGWDNPRSQGRFAYLDTEPYGGVTIELLWNKPRSQ